jgi:hypothetical protein
MQALVHEWMNHPHPQREYRFSYESWNGLYMIVHRVSDVSTDLWVVRDEQLCLKRSKKHLILQIMTQSLEPGNVVVEQFIISVLSCDHSILGEKLTYSPQPFLLESAGITCLLSHNALDCATQHGTQKSQCRPRPSVS